MSDDDILKPCLWRIASRSGEVIYFHCDVHDHNKVGYDPKKES